MKMHVDLFDSYNKTIRREMDDELGFIIERNNLNIRYAIETVLKEELINKKNAENLSDK